MKKLLSLLLLLVPALALASNSSRTYQAAVYIPKEIKVITLGRDGTRVSDTYQIRIEESLPESGEPDVINLIEDGHVITTGTIGHCSEDKIYIRWHKRNLKKSVRTLCRAHRKR